jgi:hypothetical protein
MLTSMYINQRQTSLTGFGDGSLPVDLLFMMIMELRHAGAGSTRESGVSSITQIGEVTREPWKLGNRL